MPSVLVLLVCLSVVTARAAVVPQRPEPEAQDGHGAEVSSPLRVAQCRATCLLKFANGKEDTCLQDPDCYICWKNCELLQTNYPIWGSMCHDKRICYPGCQEACRFHHETSLQGHQQAEPVIQTKGEEVLTLNTLPLGAGVITWPPAVNPNVVYVLMARPAGSSTWRQISQSTESEARIEAGNPVLGVGTTIRVLVVDPEGLVTILSPTHQPTPSVILSTLAPEIVQQQALLQTIKSKVDDESNEEQEPWRLEEVSLLHQRVLVIAEVSWAPRARRGVYLVTWELDGGGLKGNLFTDSTCVTLSLWPDTVYHIQVELVSRLGEKRHPAAPRVERSEVLLIDTRKAPQVEAGRSAPSAEPWEEVASRRSRRQLTEELLAAGRSSPIVSVMTPKDCCDELAAGPTSDDLFLSFPSIKV
ncbi:uncharacterized protein LOC132199619 isoform X2 [Neocloeon triangulifer]|uniref:uncharacterized protein LOC132199619 isoform X2 n=1 Tax=Neocloeon triangulifer TaxID=2078957 RepID=UPI00286F99BC|nr:uncharacterized protein LOC132199619 isoform X2 [Neocloeon triangulifer]